MSPPTSAVFTLHVRCPAGTLAIGGYSPTPEELAVVHAHERVSVTDDATSREEMRPLIPATALRGALREALEGALRGAGIAACRGGDGVPPDEQPQTGDPEPARRCVLDAGQPCRACRLFGTQQGAQRGDGQFFGALVLGDARSATAPTWTVTPGVGIDRSHRSAREGIFFNRQAPAPGSAIEYVADLRLLELPAERGLDADALARRRAQLRHDLKVAIALTGHIGSGTSRGLGRVELRLADAAADADAASAAAQPAITGDRQLVVTLERPANLGGPFGEENVRRTASVVPGSALRGAIGWAIAERITAAGRHPDDDAVFQALVAEDGAIFDHLHPCEGAPPDGITGPWPITRRRCKRDATHRRFDVLATRIAASQVRRLDEARAVHALAAAGVRCADHTDTGERCDGPMTPEGGHRGQRMPLERRIITRVSLDGRRRSAREGMLFGTEVLEAGARFVGSIRRVPPGAEAHLAAGLAAPLSLGRGRSMGWGRARVELAEPAKRASLAARGAVFEAALAGTLAACGLAERLAVDRVVALTCLTPLIGGEGDDAAVVGDAIGAARPVVFARRFGVESGWDQRRGALARWRSVEAGAVYVFELDAPWRALLDRLEAIEREGIGSERARGYGRVVFFDPAWSNLNADKADEMGAKRDGDETQQLVRAAEEVMRRHFVADLAPRKGKGLTKSQMSQLIGVCQEASCHEEVVNYLRYQAGRQDAPWTTDLVGAVSDAIEAVFSAHGMAPDEHARRLSAWQRFATYLARSFTWYQVGGKA